MTRTIDIPTFQTAVVRNCSPTLAGIKPASLFTYPGVYANQNGKPSTPYMKRVARVCLPSSLNATASSSRSASI